MFLKMSERTPWVCPHCGRHFARRGQGHECVPAMTLAEYFSTGPAFERPVFDAVIAHLETIGPVHVEPVSVGIFLKRVGTIAELRPMRRWVGVSFTLQRVVRHPLIVRQPILNHGRRYFHVVNMSSPGELDDEIRGWLTEAYLDAG
jgi:Domain of unknown function (DUF5655)